MPRPRSNKSPRKGGTSFGKRSEGEKAYRKKSTRPDEGDKKRSFGGPSGFRKSSAPFNARPDRNEGGSSRPFSGRGESPRPFRAKPGFSKDDFKRPERSSRSEGGADFKKEFKKPEGFHRSDRKDFAKGKSDDFKRPSGFEKRSPRFDRTNDAGGKDFKKPFRSKGDFTKKTDGDFRSQRDEKSFGKEERKSFVQSRVVTLSDFTKPGRKPKTEEPEETEVKRPDGLVRLNKYIANSGVGSRRDADKLITMGLITVNGTTVTELGTKVKPGDVVRYEDKILKAEKLVYILLNKPKGFITTTDDPQERNTVMGLVAGACKERIYPVGRLDRNTTGLLLLTNDGDLADKLTHPSYKAKKIYKVELDKPITKADFQKVQEGVRLEEGRAMVDDVAIISDDNKTLGLEIHIGWNRVVRRIFETLGYVVVKLDRSVYAGLDKKDTPRGNWRFLKSEEIVMLKHFK